MQEKRVPLGSLIRLSILLWRSSGWWGAIVMPRAARVESPMMRSKLETLCGDRKTLMPNSISLMCWPELSVKKAHVRTMMKAKWENVIPP
jgi:hypothetical protein